MSVAASCPNAQMWQRFSVDQLSVEEMKSLAAHVVDCQRCIQTLNSLQLRQKLIEALASRQDAEQPDQAEAVQTLIKQLKAGQTVAAETKEAESQKIYRDYAVPVGSSIPKQWLGSPTRSGSIRRGTCWWLIARAAGLLFLIAVCFATVLLIVQVLVNLPKERPTVNSPTEKTAGQPVLPPNTPQEKVAGDPALLPNLPLSLLALVAKPAQITDVQSWSIETTGHRGAITDMAYSLDGKWLATTGEDGTLRLWHASNGKLKSVFVLPVFKKAQPVLAWAPDSRQIAVSTGDEVAIWDVITGQRARSLLKDINATSLAWSPNGKQIAVSAHTSPNNWGTINKVLDPISGKLIHSLEGWNFQSSTFSSDSKMLGVRGETSTSIQFWDCTKYELLHTITDKSFEFSDARLRWSPDGKLLAIHLSTWGRVNVYDAVQYKLLATFEGKDHKHGGLYLGGLAWLADSQTLACTFSGIPAGPAIALIEARTGKLVRTLASAPFQKSFAKCLAASADGKSLALSTLGHGGLALYDVASGKPWKILSGHWLRNVRSLHWPLDGKSLTLNMIGGPSKQLSSWETFTGKLLNTAYGPELKPFPSPDGEKWVDEDFKIGIVDQFTKSRVEVEQPKVDICYFAWSADSKWLATLPYGADVRIWEAATGKLVKSIPRPDVPGCGGLGFHPAGKTLAVATGNEGGGVAFYQFPSGNLLNEIGTQKKWVFSLAFAPNAKKLAVGLEGGKVKLYSADGQHELRIINAHPGRAVTALVWSPDGKVLASGSGQPIYEVGEGVRLWDAATGQPVAVIVPLDDGEGLTLSADGHYRIVPQNMEQSLVYVVQTAQGQKTLTPWEFEKNHGWANDPSKVKLTK